MFNGIFHFYSSLIENNQANSGDPDQTPLSVASDLGLHYLPMSHKKDADINGLKMQLICLSHKVEDIWELYC